MNNNLKSKKLFTIGSVVCSIIGIIVYSYLLWAFPLFSKNTLMTDYYQKFIRLFVIIVFSSVTNAILVYKSSLDNFRDHHVIRAALFGLGNMLGWTIYYLELQERHKKATKNSLLYGTIAIGFFIFMLVVIFLYNTRI